jgi:hypothetical protein
MWDGEAWVAVTPTDLNVVTGVAYDEETGECTYTWTKVRVLPPAEADGDTEPVFTAEECIDNVTPQSVVVEDPNTGLPMTIIVLVPAP